jgi:hypothetical protein
MTLPQSGRPKGKAAQRPQQSVHRHHIQEKPRTCAGLFHF